MKKYLLFTAAIVLSTACLMAVSQANATIQSEYYAPEYWGDSGPNYVTWPQECSGDAVEFSIRAADLSSGPGDKEIYYMIGGNPDMADAGSFAISNGVDFDFTLTHDAASGDFTWGLDGGPSTTWHSGRPGEAVQNIFLVAFSKSNRVWTTTVNNLVLNGQPISDTLFSADGDKPSMRIFGEPFSDFTLQGTGNFAWTGQEPPQGSQVEFRISVVFADDDIDGDGFGNACDNCPNISSTDLSDTDNDGVGNICDFCPSDPTNDEDNDGICGLFDNCPLVSNADQADCNGNGIGDACDAVNPGAAEICDNLDNNCDGSIDENLTQATGCGTGECGATGIETCTAGTWGGDTCTPGTPSAETCDNLDNNCDGSIDENLTQTTGCGTGECGATGIETCTAGTWGGDTCTPGTPSAETCDNLDNNCDGFIDEDLTQATSCGTGECGATGIETCTSGIWGGDTCTPGTPSAETCDNLDNNCDGSIDEDLTRVISCERVGVCVNDTGVLSCIGGLWDNTCDTTSSATTEICDTLDNDCDGIIDEGVTTTFYYDLDGDTFGTTNVTEDTCSASPGFVSVTGDCNDNDVSIYPGAVEICGDGIDQDCSGGDEVCTNTVQLESGGYFDAIQIAYDTIATGSTDIIKMQAIEFAESVILNYDVVATLRGGYDELFTAPSGYTTIASSGAALMIINGSATIDNIILK